MRNECNIIRDILPLYAENMVSPDTAEFVEAHLDGCETCRVEYQRAKEPPPAREPSGAAPLRKLRRRLQFKRVQTVALTAVFVAAVLVSAFAVLDAPLYFPYSEGLVTLQGLDGKGMLLTFDEAVTDFRCTVLEDPDSGGYSCDIEAWTSLWDQWFPRGKGNLSAAVGAGDTQPVTAIYVPNDGTENIHLARYDPATGTLEEAVYRENRVTLPRLSLGYYAALAAAALAVMGMLWLLARKKAGPRAWIERIGLYPAAYLVSHCVVSGVNWATYSLPRDLALTVLLSVLLYGGLLLGRHIWRGKRGAGEAPDSPGDGAA